MIRKESQLHKEDSQSYKNSKKKLLELLRDGLVTGEEYDTHLKFLEQCENDPARKIELSLYFFKLAELETKRKSEHGLIKKPMTEEEYEDYSKQLHKEPPAIKKIPKPKTKKVKGAGTWMDRSNPND